MRILTQPLHTGYDYELAKTGNDFFCLGMGWDSTQRPKPENWNLIDQPHGKYSVAVAGTIEGFDRAIKLGLPTIWIVHADATRGKLSEQIERHAKAVVFSSREVSGRVSLPDLKKAVIEHSIDCTIYKTGSGITGDVLAIGNLVGKRSDKGPGRLVEIDQFRPVVLLGAMNEGLRCAIGAARDYADYVNKLGQYKIYLNPSDIVSTAMLEGMASGLPPVTFEPTNFQDLIIDGSNGFVVHQVDQAVERIGRLLSDAGLRMRMGSAARKTVQDRFRPERFQMNWNNLLRRVAGWP